MFEWKRRIEKIIDEGVVGIRRKTIFLIIAVMIAFTLFDFYFDGFSIAKLFILEVVILSVLINIKLLKI